MNAANVEQSCRTTFENGALLSLALTSDPASLADLTARFAGARGFSLTAADVRAAIEGAAPGLADLDDDELGMGVSYDKTGTDEKCTCRGGGTCR